MRLGVMGLGAMGWNHARVAASLDALGGVADSRGELRDRAQAAYGAPVFESGEDLLRSDVDGVIVATPTSTHHELAKEALLAGKHVLVEKPIAATPAEARDLVATAREQGLTLAVGHIERHNPVVGYAKDALDKGGVGRLLSVSARRVSQFPGRIRDVGCILDIGIHEIDIIRYLADSPITEVHALTSSHKARGFEDLALMLLRCENGVSATIQTNWMTPMRVRRNSLTCTEGMLELDYMEQSASIKTAQYDNVDPSQYPPQVEYHDQRVVLRRQEPLQNQMRDFLRAAETRTTPLVTGEDGVRALCVAEGAVRSARDRKTVHFLEETEPLLVEAIITR